MDGQSVSGTVGRLGVVAVALCLLTCPLGAQTTAGRPDAPAAWQALEGGDAERAAALFRGELSRAPGDPTLHYGAGVAAFLLGRHGDAARSLRRALELEPRLTEASRLLGEIEYRQGDVDGAVRAYERALVHAPGDAKMRARLETWRQEAALHRTLTQRNDGRFSIVFEGRSDRALTDHAFRTLDAAYWRIGKALNSFPSSSITVTLYTEQQFRDLTGAPDWSSGRFDGRIRLAVRGALQDRPQFDRVLAHELTHALVSMIAPRGVPRWLHEGLASYFEPRDPAEALRMLKSSGLVPVNGLVASFRDLTALNATVAYMQSLVVVDVLMRRLGPRMGMLLQSLDRGQTLEDSLLLLGTSVAEVDAELRRLAATVSR